VIDFTNAGIVCLAYQEECWQATWILTPAIAGLGSQFKDKERRSGASALR
jgi:hypothetical protein